ncbi:nuclease-related domain-containing protein [Marinobacter sp. ATCH36]|uniref:nuclease-related domain-containing protein n=1 Tax=Marinobacter sp. ATCH36 TaxID=2945106 RepID=UPI00201FCA58|nr:nuclease-related domain-containing protein [Marinobacter sp. ATCH36]MCL7943637.1 NERD domain-containing protein [Marinobacter sp. ATCH36]
MIDLGSTFQGALSEFWYLILPFIIVALVRTPWFKGKAGEFLVNVSARRLLEKSRYHLINNVTLPTEDGTTQIDHVLISEFGVFVVETKNMKGWIFGSPHQRFWTQKIFRSNHKFQNPLHQNYKHVKTLQALLGFGDHQMHSVVVFVGDSTFKTSMPDNVTRGLGYVRYIKSKQGRVLSPEQVKEALEKMASGRLKESFSTDRAHVRHVRELVSERDGVKPRRARRGLLKILVLPAMLVAFSLIISHAYSNFASKATALATKNMPEQRVERSQSPASGEPDVQIKVSSREEGKQTNVATRIQRIDQSPSKLYLAMQECNSLIAAALGNQDPRLLRDRDKACARYKVLKGEVH